MGNLSILDNDWTPTVEHSHGNLAWRAQGKTKVPTGKKLMRILNEHFNAHPDCLKNIAPDAIATINGGATEITDKTIDGILHLKDLTRWILNNTEIGDESLAKLSHPPNLRLLQIISRP